MKLDSRLKNLSRKHAMKESSTQKKSCFSTSEPDNLHSDIGNPKSTKKNSTQSLPNLKKVKPLTKIVSSKIEQCNKLRDVKTQITHKVRELLHQENLSTKPISTDLTLSETQIDKSETVTARQSIEQSIMENPVTINSSRNKPKVVDSVVIKQPINIKTNNPLTNTHKINTATKNAISRSATLSKNGKNNRPLNDISNQLAKAGSNVFINNVVNAKDKEIYEAKNKIKILENTLKKKEESVKILRSENRELLEISKTFEEIVTEYEQKLNECKLELQRVENLNSKWQETAIHKCEMIASKLPNKKIFSNKKY